MSNPYQSTYIHKHFHYHYHCDGNDASLQSTTERCSSPEILTPQKSSILPTKSSWKNRINPEITQRYEEIGHHSSFENTFTPKVSRQRPEQSQQFYTVEQPKCFKYSNPKQDLLNQIQNYERYLRQHSRLNLYVPNSLNLKKPPIHNQNLHSRNQTGSLNDLLLINDGSQKYLDGMDMTRANSKMLSTNQEMETALQNQKFRKYQQKNAPVNQINSQKLIRRSEIKSPQKNSILSYAKNRMSHLQDPLHRQEQLENSSFSLFQRQVQKQSGSERNSQTSIKSQNQQSNVLVNLEQFNKYQRINEKIDSYQYELMKQQCKFLRNKFIQHAQNKHGVKF